MNGSSREADDDEDVRLRCLMPSALRGANQDRTTVVDPGMIERRAFRDDPKALSQRYERQLRPVIHGLTMCSIDEQGRERRAVRDDDWMFLVVDENRMAKPTADAELPLPVEHRIETDEWASRYRAVRSQSDHFRPEA